MSPTTSPTTPLNEPDRRVDDLIDWISTQNEPGLAQWAVEALAGGVGVEIAVVVGDDDVDRVRSLAETLGDTVVLAHARGGEDQNRLVQTAIAGFVAALARE